MHKTIMLKSQNKFVYSVGNNKAIWGCHKKDC